MAKKITKWEPEDFELEMTTHWSFPKRGDWATHDAKWRGNWSPYVIGIHMPAFFKYSCSLSTSLKTVKKPVICNININTRQNKINKYKLNAVLIKFSFSRNKK